MRCVTFFRGCICLRHSSRVHRLSVDIVLCYSLLVFEWQVIRRREWRILESLTKDAFFISPFVLRNLFWHSCLKRTVVALASAVTFLSQLSLQAIPYDNVSLCFNACVEVSTHSVQSFSIRILLDIEARFVFLYWFHQVSHHLEFCLYPPTSNHSN